MKYYLIAGEASGDLHGANLIRALSTTDPAATIRFWGGDLMQEACDTACKNRCTRVRHIKDLAYMGFIEVATHLGTVMGNIRLCKKVIVAFNPDAIIYIDYPGFNLKIARFAHKKGYRNFHYISPQLWAWKKGRINGMRRDLDHLFYILPFEQKFYHDSHFPQATYVGHPLLDAIGQFVTQPVVPKATLPVVALLPGSRRQELKKMLPTMVLFAQRHPEYLFVVAGMSLVGKTFYDTLINSTLKGTRLSNLTLVIDETYSLLASAHAAIVCSGTATLETALFKVPQVVCYRANALSIAIARFFVGRRVRFISLVNLIADKAIVTELIQGDLDIQRLENEFQKIATNGISRCKMLEGYAELRDILGGGGASQRTADAIIHHITH